MVSSAQLAVSDFARFTGEVGLTLYGQDFLFGGSATLPSALKERYPHLRNWHGPAQLKSSLRMIAAAPSGHDCMLAGRSLSLIRMAAKHLSRKCRRVLILDLCWPAYAQAIRDELSRRGKETVLFSARQAILNRKESASEFLVRLMTTFGRQRCDGAFFPAVSHDGIRLPADTIARDLRANAGARFILVDVAQAFAQVSNEIGATAADLLIGGSHKWLGAGLPLGFAIGSQEVITDCHKLLTDDPLATLTSSKAQKKTPPVTETVNVWPLLSCNAAAGELASSRQPLPSSPESQRTMRDQLESALSGSPWELIYPPWDFRSAIVLARHSNHGRVQREHWRKHYHRLGIALTSYGALIRLSLPAKPFSAEEHELFADAFAASTTGQPAAHSPCGSRFPRLIWPNNPK